MLISKNLVLTVAHNIYDKDNSLFDNNKSQQNLLKYELDKSTFKFYVGGVLG
jgi:V8-like Glu-specific endopeptidase